MFEIQGARHMFSPEAKISCRRMSGVYQEFWVEKMEVRSQRAPRDY